jgi:hypothetical protein
MARKTAAWTAARKQHDEDTGAAIATTAAHAASTRGDIAEMLARIDADGAIDLAEFQRYVLGQTGAQATALERATAKLGNASGIAMITTGHIATGARQISAAAVFGKPKPKQLKGSNGKPKGGGDSPPTTTRKRGKGGGGKPIKGTN